MYLFLDAILREDEMPHPQVGLKTGKNPAIRNSGLIRGVRRRQSTAVRVTGLYLEHIGGFGGLWYIPPKCSAVA
jgi:hypothetical protein